MSRATGVRSRQEQPAGEAGVRANQKMTALTGAVLLVGFAIEGCTLLSLRSLLAVHFLVGLLLVGPVLLKVASTGYRFMRYYTGAQAYVRRGPPAPVLRVLGPLVIATTAAVLGTGIALGIAGPGHSWWLFLHRLSFIAWFGVMTIHVLNYAPRLPGILRAPRARSPEPHVLLFSGPARWLALAGALAVGIAVAAVTMHYSSGWGVSLSS